MRFRLVRSKPTRRPQRHRRRVDGSVVRTAVAPDPSGPWPAHRRRLRQIDADKLKIGTESNRSRLTWSTRPRRSPRRPEPQALEIADLRTTLQAIDTELRCPSSYKRAHHRDRHRRGGGDRGCRGGLRKQRAAGAERPAAVAALATRLPPEVGAPSRLGGGTGAVRLSERERLPLNADRTSRAGRAAAEPHETRPARSIPTHSTRAWRCGIDDVP